MTPAMTLPPELANEFVDIDSALTFNYVLQPGQVQNGLQQPIAGDGDFYLCGMHASSVLLQRPDLIELAGNIGLRISDDLGYRLMSDYVNIAFFTPINGNSYPYAIPQTHMFKAGTRINIDLQELSNVANVPNIVQIVFRGRYRYRMATVMRQSALLAQAKAYKMGWS